MPCEAGRAQVPAATDKRVPVFAPVEAAEGFFLYAEALGKFFPAEQEHGYSFSFGS